jgi:hypothetical protein
VAVAVLVVSLKEIRGGEWREARHAIDGRTDRVDYDEILRGRASSYQDRKNSEDDELHKGRHDSRGR